jgi:hypothetical protein
VCEFGCFKVSLTDSSPDERYNKGVCLFCGNSGEIHSWSSFESKESNIIAPRWQPSHCTLHELLDCMAQDFFPGRKVVLNIKRSRFMAAFTFDEVDDLFAVMSTTRVELHGEETKIESFQAFNINQQLETLKGWLKICGKESVQSGKNAYNDDKNSVDGDKDVHDACPEFKIRPIPSKRILDLSSAATGIVRVIETADRKARYAALSHCWGHPTRHPLMTTRATLNEHTSGIAISCLPRSFTDAMRVCFHLGVQYLWIDCLCIVQDDRYDHRHFNDPKTNIRLVMSGAQKRKIWSRYIKSRT